MAIGKKGKSRQVVEESPFAFGDAAVPGQESAGKGLVSPDTPAAVYSEGQRGRFSLDPRLRTTVLLLVLAVILVPVSAVLPQHVFGYAGFNSSLAKLGSSLGGRIAALFQIGSGSAAGMAAEIYLCQILAVAIAGAALALNGAVYQGALKNALASPSTLGVMSGATLGNLVYTMFILFPMEQQQSSLLLVDETQSYLATLDPLAYLAATQGRVMLCIAGCAVSVALVLSVAFIAGRGRISKVGLLVTGQVFSAVVASVIEMAQYYLRDHGTEAQQQAIRSIVGGNFNNFIDWYDIMLLAVPVAIGAAIVLGMRNRLNLLAFDDEDARSMGINVNVTRNAVIAVCTVLTAVIVSFCGSVGFVGFLVPHLARKMVGPDFRFYIPASLCLGAAYLTIAYYLMNMSGLFQGSVGTFTSVIGLVWFAVMAVRQRARGNVDWL